MYISSLLFPYIYIYHLYIYIHKEIHTDTYRYIHICIYTQRFIVCFDCLVLINRANRDSVRPGAGRPETPPWEALVV